MKREFEEYFPLPWKTTKEKDVVFINGQGRNIPVIIAEGSAAECAEREALRYAVQCSNLMPEAVEVLNEADDHMGALLAAVCDDCPKLGTEDCEECPPYKTLRKIGVLLAKLEGGAEDERD